MNNVNTRGATGPLPQNQQNILKRMENAFKAADAGPQQPNGQRAEGDDNLTLEEFLNAQIPDRAQLSPEARAREEQNWTTAFRESAGADGTIQEGEFLDLAQRSAGSGIAVGGNRLSRQDGEQLASLRQDERNEDITDGIQDSISSGSTSVSVAQQYHNRQSATATQAARDARTQRNTARTNVDTARTDLETARTTHGANAPETAAAQTRLDTATRELTAAETRYTEARTTQTEANGARRDFARSTQRTLGGLNILGGGANVAGGFMKLTSPNSSPQDRMIGAYNMVAGSANIVEGAGAFARSTSSLASVARFAGPFGAIVGGAAGFADAHGEFNEAMEEGDTVGMISSGGEMAGNALLMAGGVMAWPPAAAIGVPLMVAGAAVTLVSKAISWLWGD